ncbi:UNVERIFIED_ORG: hypothetical protein J3D58_002126 [Paenarthrobacter nicotinovorans]
MFESATPPRLSTGCLPAVCTGSRCHYAFKGQRNILAVIDIGVIDIAEWGGRDNAGRNHSTYGRSGRLGRAAYRRGGGLHQGEAPHELPAAAILLVPTPAPPTLASITAAGVVLFLVIAALVASAAAKRESLTK